MAKRFAVALAALVWVTAPAWAQRVPRGVLAPGDAVVTGFSGALAPVQIAPVVDPRERIFIDVNGASLRVIDLENMGGPPQAQLVNAPKRYVAAAEQIGQVFAVALDNAVPPNIYVAATSAYGLPIVVAEPGADPRHVRIGAPNARFMPGVWGPRRSGAGPGSVWRIKGLTGVVSLFANVTLNGVPNSGPALGGLAFDPDSQSLFVADRETGIIHRFNTNGAETDRYDHGVQGRTAVGLRAVPQDPSRRLDITNPQFDSEQPSTWNYAPPERRIFGLGVRAGRLYYAVADGLQIWSVAISRGASREPALEISVPPADGPTEISKIAFDDMGRMFLAERPDPTGAYDFKALTTEGTGRVLRYALVEPYPGAQRVWQPDLAEYAIGFPLTLRNGNGGIAIGYSYDLRGALDRSTCGGFLWSTGEQLRAAAQAALSLRLASNGPAAVDGLQGSAIAMVRPNNVPPLATYFVDYDDRFEEEDGARGHLGDITIWRPCGPSLRGGWMWSGWMIGWWGRGGLTELPPPDKVDCPADRRKPGFQCCPQGSSPDANGQCRPWCPNGAMDAKSQHFCGLGFDPTTYDPNDLGKLRCIGGTAPDQAKGIVACIASSPIFGAPVCPAGWSKQNVANIGTICTPTTQQLQCGLHQQVSSIDNKCHNLCLGIAWPTQQCCPPGSVITVAGKCCPPGSTADPRTGQCNPPITGRIPDPDTDRGTPCPPGAVANVESGQCEPPPPFTCPASQVSTEGACCPAAWVPNTISGGCCPPGQSAAANGICRPLNCEPPGKLVGGKCCSPNDLKEGGACATASCGAGKIPIGASNACCDVSRVYTGSAGVQQCCATGKVVDGRCPPPTHAGVPALPGCQPGSSDPICCTDGYKVTGSSCCLASQLTSLGACCPAGQAPSGADRSQCVPIRLGWVPPVTFVAIRETGGQPGGQCCLPGLIPLADGSCCPPDRATSLGVCCPAGQHPVADRCVRLTTATIPRAPPHTTLPVTPRPPGLSAAPVGPHRKRCPQGTRLLDGSCVPQTSVGVPARTLSCPPGKKPNAARTACIGTTLVRPGLTVKPKPPSSAAAPIKRVPPPKATTTLRGKAPVVVPKKLPQIPGLK